MKKIFILSGIILTVLLVGIILYVSRPIKTQSDDKRPVIKIGVILQLSGDMAGMGMPMKNAVMMAKEDLAQKETKYQYELIVEDDAFESRKTAGIFQKFKNIDQVNAIVSVFSQSGNVIAPLAEENKILHIGLASDPTVAVGKYNFTHWVSPEATSGRLYQFYKDRGYKKIAVFLVNNAGTLILRDELMKHVNPADKFTFKTFTVTPQEKDYRMMLAEAKKFNPDAYLVILYAGNLSAFAKQFHEAGITAPITNIESFQTLKNFDGLEGAYFTDAADGNENFINQYNKQFPEQPIYGVGHVYDNIMMAVSAFEEADSPEQAIDVLSKKTTYEGVISVYPQNSEGIFATPAELKKIQNKKPIRAEGE